jgi:hypothetical protein
MFMGSRARLLCNADNLTAICEPWDHQHFTTLRPSTACYLDRFTFTFYPFLYGPCLIKKDSGGSVLVDVRMMLSLPPCCNYEQVALKHYLHPQSLPLRYCHTERGFPVPTNKLWFNGNPSDPYSVSCTLRSLQGDQLFWFNFLWLSSFPPGKSGGSISDSQQQFPSNPLPVFCSSDFLSFHFKC